ncbi:MAG: acetyl-CoA carboxylase, carboxyltransferase subunit beta [Candidatus Aquicultorales bacterium]
MPIGEWFGKKNVSDNGDAREAKLVIPDGVWLKCDSCNEVIFHREFERSFKVCPKCGFHTPLSALERITQICDAGSFKETSTGFASCDPLGFCSSKPYTQVVEAARAKTGLTEAVVSGMGLLDGRPVAVITMDFSFIGGSMGSVVGEKVTELFEIATTEGLPVIGVCASGGARMQEGMYSLVQMAKTSAAVGRHSGAGLPYISLLCHPTTGGVLASFATLADVIMAEPKALIGFTGPRIIEQTMKQKLPKGFQTAEFMLEHGQVDMIVPRSDQKDTIGRVLDYLTRD